MSPTECDVLPVDVQARAAHAIRHWAGYEPTPLVRLRGRAQRGGVAEFFYKNEAARFGLGSFKALGGGYAVQALCESGPPAARVFATATDGNHGRAVAWAAQRVGARAVVYLHETVSAGREDAIAAYGATIVRVPGVYDDAVRKAAHDAAREGWTIVSDTSWPGYETIPRLVMAGYALLVEEILAQSERPPTHVFVQAGVGSLAASVCAAFWTWLGALRPKLIVAEPVEADCLFASARADALMPATGAVETLMAGLACGEASPLAWNLLRTGADAFVLVTDSEAQAAMISLARPNSGDPQLVAGESAVAGLCAFELCRSDTHVSAALGLDSSARVLVIGTEGATDPELYRRLVGMDPGAAIEASPRMHGSSAPQWQGS